MREKPKNTSKSKLKRNFTIGIVITVLLLGTLNIQMWLMASNMRTLNNALGELALGGTTGQQPTPSPTPDPTPQASLDARDIIGNSPTLGNPDASVVIVSWNDFRCGFCGRFKDQTLPLIESNYIDNDDVLYVFKHFPVVGGENEALASLCAQDQGYFWEFHDRVFESSGYSPSDFSVWAGELGMDVSEFDECFSTRRHEDRIMEDAQLGMSAGVQGTPGFLVNDVLVSGAQPFENFEQIIEAFLS